MKRPDMPANPLQELAADLASEIVTHLGAQNGLAITTLPAYEIVKLVITNSPAVGTLLQAERAALCEIFVGHRYVTREFEYDPLCSCGYERPEGCWDDCGCYYDHIRTLGDASALSAVVQRETAKATAAEYDRWCKFLKSIMDEAAKNCESTAK